MKDRRADLAGSTGEFRVALELRTGHELLRRVARQRARTQRCGASGAGRRRRCVDPPPWPDSWARSSAPQPGRPSGCAIAPREVGRRLHTEAVNAGNGCSGSPNLSSDSGCTWYSTLGRCRSALDIANAPSWLGLIVSGPRRVKAYCSAMPSLAKGLDASVLSVRTPCTLNAMRSCRWSCRLAPTPGRSRWTGIPRGPSSAAGPMPDNCSSCGDGDGARRQDHLAPGRQFGPAGHRARPRHRRNGGPRRAGATPASR